MNGSTIPQVFCPLSCQIFHRPVFSARFSEVGIESFTLPVTELPYPAITICKKNGLYDPGEYLRAVFNKFEYAYRAEEQGSSGEEVHSKKTSVIIFLKQCHFNRYCRGERNPIVCGHHSAENNEMQKIYWAPLGIKLHYSLQTQG